MAFALDPMRRHLHPRLRRWRLSRGRWAEEEKDRLARAEEDMAPGNGHDALELQYPLVEFGRLFQIFGVKRSFKDPHLFSSLPVLQFRTGLCSDKFPRVPVTRASIGGRIRVH